MVAASALLTEVSTTSAGAVVVPGMTTPHLQRLVRRPSVGCQVLTGGDIQVDVLGFFIVKV
jgi:hypothetical protein